MISSTPVKSSHILHISKPLRGLIKKIMLGILVAIAIIGILVSKNDSQFSYDVRTTVLDVVSPVIETISIPVTFISNFGDSFNNYLFVHSKNQELVKENQKLTKKLISLSGIHYENYSLKNLLNYVEKLDYKYISAKVVGNASGPFYSSIIINVGENDNVTKGQAVVNEFGLVGRVLEVAKKSSRVLLLTDINSNIPVISSQSRERSIMTGNNDENPRLLYLPNESKSVEGEIVSTSGDGDMYPSGIHVGIIKINSNGIRYVQPFAQWHNLENISVIDYSK